MKNIRFKRVSIIISVGIASYIIVTILFGLYKNYQWHSFDYDKLGSFQEKSSKATVFYLDPDLQLLNGKNRKTVKLKFLCGSKTKLAFRYFGINCKDCIQNVIIILQYIFKDDFYSDVVLLNDSYVKTYLNYSTNSNEFYVNNLYTNFEKNKLPYFFIISPDSKITCEVVLVPDVNDLKSTEEDIKAFVKKKYLH